MEYTSSSDLINNLSLESKVDATANLTEFYAKARFGISDGLFNSHYTDGANDGGIDFFYKEDNTFYIFQTKFTSDPKNAGESEIMHEINKIKNTLIGHNPNNDAKEFISKLRNFKKNKSVVLEIIWLTTNIVKGTVKKAIQDDLVSWKKEIGWALNIDFISIDKHSLDSIIYDIEHGYVPYTGKQVLKLEPKNWIETNWDETGVHSVICNVNVNYILEWFIEKNLIDKFLQKNVREFLGEASKINKEIGKSYKNDPMWFWYKHNGIIIFADNLKVDKTRLQLEMRNPQVVNGGQTLQSLFPFFLSNDRNDNGAKILLRVFRLPYEDTETYKRSIDIISALNTQNKINPSDLRSTDPRQVRLERLFKEVGYKYWRKRSKEAKSLPQSITMRNLAIRFHVCKRRLPQDGARGNIETLFEEENKYEQIFPENSINQELNNNHILVNYITCWRIDQILKNMGKELPKRDFEYFRYTKWYALNDVYHKTLDWKKSKFEMGRKGWGDFIDSPRFDRAVSQYSRSAFKLGREILPKNDEPAAFFKSKQAAYKYNKRVTNQKFITLVNKAFNMFKNEY